MRWAAPVLLHAGAAGGGGLLHAHAAGPAAGPRGEQLPGDPRPRPLHPAAAAAAQLKYISF